MHIARSLATPEDAAFLEELFFEVHAPELRLAGLAGPALSQLLAMQHRGQQTSYALNFPVAVNEIIRVDGERAGRLLTDTSADAVRIVDIALLHAFRRRGVGTHLLGELCKSATAAALPIRLSVRPGNPAQRLYERMGFVVTGVSPTEIEMRRATAETT